MSLQNVSQTLKATITELQEERAEITSQIEALKSALAALGSSPVPKRRGPGRPKGSKNKAATEGKTAEPKAPKVKTTKRKRAKWTPEQKAAAAERMKKYWAKRNKDKK